MLTLVAGSAPPAGGCAGDLADGISALIARDFKWELFLKLAAYQHSMPAAYRLFKDLGILQLASENTQQILEQEYLLSQARFIKKESELLDIIGAMKREGIDGIVLKGVPLAYVLYGDPGIRTLKDIDILIRPSDVEAAKRIVLEKGYSLYTALQSAEDYRDYHFHYVFSRGARLDSIVEIHWSLVYPNMDHRVADDDAIFNKAFSVAVRGASIETLGLPHALWHMAMHVSYKSFLGFRNLAEVKRIAMKLDESDWRCVFAWSRRCNTDLELQIALNLSESLFGEFLGSDVRKTLSPRFLARTFILGMYYPRSLVWEWVPFRDTHALAVELILRKSVASRLRCLYHFVRPDRQTAFKYYFAPGNRKIFHRMKSSLNGMYVVLKVLALISFFSFIVKGRLFGAEFLDPQRHKKLEGV